MAPKYKHKSCAAELPKETSGKPEIHPTKLCGQAKTILPLELKISVRKMTEKLRQKVGSFSASVPLQS